MKTKSAWPEAALAAIALACLSEKSAVAAADVPIAVLGIEATEAPDALASSLTEALRQRVQSTKGYRLVPGRDLVEVKLVFSCPDEAPSCMAQAGKSLGATKLIFGSVKKSIGDSFLVTLKLLDANRSIVDAFVAEQITKSQASGAAIRGPVQKWFATLTGQGGAGIIKVRTDVIGASVALDGNPSGIVGTDDLVLSGVSPGKHEVTIAKSGYDVAKREVSVASGETASVDVKMIHSAAAVSTAPPPPAPPITAVTTPVGSPGVNEPPPPVHDTGAVGNPMLKAATWATLGGSVVAIALGVKFGLDVQSVNKDLDEYRRFPCAMPPSNLCNAQMKMKEPLSPLQVTYVKAKKDDGQRLELYQYISYGVGGALLLTSGYLFYRAYLGESNERAQGAAPRFALVPVLGPTQAGAAAYLRF
jgi:hypothetical protein